MISHIVAMDRNGTIGCKGALPWHLSHDLRRFKRLTLGRTIVMGRKTFESIGKPLPGRLNLVLSRDQSFRPSGVQVVSSIDEALDICSKNHKAYGDEVFIIGGGTIYQQTIAEVSRIYLTKIDASYDGDAWYPNLDNFDFEMSEQADFFNNKFKYSFVTLCR